MEGTDAIVKAIEAALLSLHPLTNSIFTGVTTYRGDMEMRFVRDVIVGVNERVYKLEQKLDKEYMKSDDYMNFLFKTLRMAARDVRKEKLNLFANIIVNAALLGNADEHDSRKYLYDETIDKIDERLFGFLFRIVIQSKKNNDGQTEGWQGNEEELRLLGVDEKTFFFYADYLLSVGVLMRLPKFQISDMGHLLKHDEYYLTQYGVEFVEYVRDCD